MTMCSQMAPLEAAQLMIGLGTLGSWKIWYKYQQESPALGGLTFTMNTVTLC